MSAQVYDLEIEQGAHFFWSFVYYTPDQNDPTKPSSTPVDLTGWKVRMQIRKNQQTEAYVTATSENGKFTIDGSNGKVSLILTDEDTDLIVAKSTQYDLEMEDDDGVVYRVYQGKVSVDPNITQELDDPIADQ